MNNIFQLRFRLLLITLMVIVFMPITIFSQSLNQQRNNGISLELLGTTTAGFGINYEYSLSQYFDIGIGTIIITPIFPPELHVFCRWNILDFPVSPFLACSLSYFQIAVADGAFFPIFCRIHAGVKWKISTFLFIGTGITYQIVGDSSFRPNVIAGNFNPSVFIGIAF